MPSKNDLKNLFNFVILSQKQLKFKFFKLHVFMAYTFEDCVVYSKHDNISIFLMPKYYTGSTVKCLSTVSYFPTFVKLDFFVDQ